MSVREYLGSMTVEELEYVRLLIEIDPTLTVLQLMEEIKKLRENKK